MSSIGPLSSGHFEEFFTKYCALNREGLNDDSLR